MQAMTEENLTPIREQVYKDPRPPEHFARFHERSRTRDPDWVYEAVRIATSLWACGRRGVTLRSHACRNFVLTG